MRKEKLLEDPKLVKHTIEFMKDIERFKFISIWFQISLYTINTSFAYVY